MTWNYRLFKQDLRDSGYFYFVAECYYDHNGKPELHSDMDHNLISADVEEDIEAVYKQISEAFEAPAIPLDIDGNFKS